MPIGVSAAPYAKFKNPGDRHGGEIVGFRVVQNTDRKTRMPLYLQQGEDGSWRKVNNAYAPDGKPNDPITQWEITVDTGIEDENGDSELRIFIDPRKGRKGSTTFGKKGGDAVTIALKKAKAHRVGLEIGGKFWLIFDGKVPDGDSEVNTWSAEYEPPADGPGTGKPLDETPILQGGERYDKRAELAKWEALKAAGRAGAAAVVPTPAPAHGEARAIQQASSERAAATASLGIRDTSVVDGDEEPPF